MADKDTIRFQITLSKELVAQLDEYAQEIGMSRSALCASYIARQVIAEKRSRDLLSQMTDDMKVQLVSMLNEATKTKN